MESFMNVSDYSTLVNSLSQLNSQQINLLRNILIELRTEIINYNASSPDKLLNDVNILVVNDIDLPMIDFTPAEIKLSSQSLTNYIQNIIRSPSIGRILQQYGIRTVNYYLRLLNLLPQELMSLNFN